VPLCLCGNKKSQENISSEDLEPSCLGGIFYVKGFSQNSLKVPRLFTVPQCLCGNKKISRKYFIRRLGAFVPWWHFFCERILTEFAESSQTFLPCLCGNKKISRKYFIRRLGAFVPWWQNFFG
jgi:hypothetical protein